MTAPYANAVVTAELDWGNVGTEFEARVRVAAEKAAKAAQKQFDRVRLAAKVSFRADVVEFRRQTQERLNQSAFSATVVLRANTAKFHADVRKATKNLPDATVKIKLAAGNLQPFVREIEERLRVARITAPVFLEVANEADFLAHIATLTRPVTQTVNIVTNGGNGSGDGNGNGNGSGSGDGRLRGGMVRRIRMQIDMDRSSVASAEAQIAALETRLSGARTKQSESLDRVRVAQARLTEVNANANSTTSQRLAATAALTRANNELGSNTARVTQTIGDQADAHHRLRRAQENQNSTSRLVRAGLGGLAETAMNMGKNLLSSISPAGLLKTALMALAALSLVPLVGQLAQAAGIISLLPAVAGAAVAGIATMVIGFTGVFDAFSKGSKAAEIAAKGTAAAAKQQEADARKRAQAAKAVASAERGVEKAVDGVERAERGVTTAQNQAEKAQKSLNQAREDAKTTIDDLNFALKGTAIDERDSVLALARAREAYDKTFADPAASALDRSEAALGVDKALRRQEEVGRRNTQLAKDAADANKKGIEGSDKVIDAKEAVAAADQGVVDANKSVVDAQEQVTLAQENLVDAQAAEAEAMSANADAIDEYADALANLSPNARRFVEEVRGLSDAWKTLRLEVQEKLFEGLGDSIVNLANNYFPLLTSGLGGIATEINGGLRRAIDDLSTDSVKLDWTKILENTRLAIGPVIDGFSELFGALTNIAAIGSDFLPGFSGSFADTMKEFREWTESDKGEQSIRNFMEKSIESLKQVKDLFLAVGDVVGGLFKSSEQTGKSMIESMTDSLREFAAWMREPENQAKMRNFWEDVRTTITDILNLVKEAGILIQKTTDLMNRAFPSDGAGTGAVGAVTSATNGDVGGVANSLGGISGDSYASVLKSAGVPGAGPLTGGAIQMGIDNVKKTWGWMTGIFGGNDGPKPSNLPSLEGGGGFAPTTGNGTAFLPGQEPTVPARTYSGGRSIGLKEFTREEWEKTFGDVEEFDRKLEELQAKAIETQEVGSSNFGTFGSNAASALANLGTGDFAAFKTNLADLGRNILGTTDEGGINWGKLGSKIGGATLDITNRIFPGFKTGLANLKEFALGIVEAFGGDWDRLKNMAADPINWIIRNVINGALKNAWNAVAAVIPGLSKWDGVAEIGTSDEGADKAFFGFASGGIAPTTGVMSGYSPGRDDRMIAVGGGEAIMRPEWTRAMGPAYVNSANAAARSGGVAGVKRFAGYFSNGGIVGNMESIMAEKFPMLLQNGRAFSSYRDGDPGYHGRGMAADFSNGGIEGTPEMKAAATWWADNFTPDLKELIHWPFNRNVKDGKDVGTGFYDQGTYMDHRHHLHVATDKMLGADGTSSPAEPGFLDRVKDAVGGAISAGRNAIAVTARGLASKPFDALKSAMPDFGGTLMGQVPGAALDAIKSSFLDKINSFIGAGGSSADAGTTPWDLGAGVEQWRGKVIEALEREGFDSGTRNQNLMLAQIKSESGGNPNIVQSVQDVNSGGNEAVGLLQVIPGTFAANRNPALPNDRTNPDASMSAALRYYRSTYGDDLGAMWGQGHGYDQGGIASGIGLMPKKILTPERVLSPEMTADFERLISVLERPDFIEILRQMPNNGATNAAANAAAASGPSTPAPAVMNAAATSGPSTAFDPNNTGYDDTFYKDTVARGGKEGADAWLARQDFGPQTRTWGINALKEIGGEFAAPLGLGERLNERIDEGAKEYMRWQGRDERAAQYAQSKSSGDTYITNEFHGYQGTPQQFIAEIDRRARQGLSVLTP
ncbi:transglycosylase SLT domain-containing protein [Rhodococcus sp. IEGM 1379]|uniref:transglycosylase SLT domain-containing protein n=1 Tax=Rhodococcus sp. IEGM 1379 TaxID=3047086 RepID=UPI0024B815A1|nr:transglycosylase SLT domain-containing protein [Rhodococcus sp. IEGM 1379]MDI9914344.1 transglycosylase SLT domain-containing protein [Rhodococcus sp. IEGM 1379]